MGQDGILRAIGNRAIEAMELRTLIGQMNRGAGCATTRISRARTQSAHLDTYELQVR